MLVAWRLVRPEAARVLSPAPEPAALLMSVLVLVLAPTAALALMRKTPLLRVPVLVRRTVMRRAEQRQNPAQAPRLATRAPPAGARQARLPTPLQAEAPQALPRVRARRRARDSAQGLLPDSRDWEQREAAPWRVVPLGRRAGALLGRAPAPREVPETPEEERALRWLLPPSSPHPKEQPACQEPDPTLEQERFLR